MVNILGKSSYVTFTELAALWAWAWVSATIAPITCPTHVTWKAQNNLEGEGWVYSQGHLKSSSRCLWSGVTVLTYEKTTKNQIVRLVLMKRFLPIIFKGFSVPGLALGSISSLASHLLVLTVLILKWDRYNTENKDKIRYFPFLLKSDTPCSFEFSKIFKSVSVTLSQTRREAASSSG